MGTPPPPPPLPELMIATRYTYCVPTIFLSRIIVPLSSLLPLLSLLPLPLLPLLGVQVARGHEGSFRLCFRVRDSGGSGRDGEKLATVVKHRR